jgi:acyl-CoA thioesterase FadM
MTELDAGGHGLIMADVMIAYRGEGFYGDVLEVKLFAEEITERTFDLLYHIKTQRNGTVIEIAQAKTGMAAIDYNTRKITTLSKVLKTWLTRL